jgi:Rrf2 family protein
MLSSSRFVVAIHALSVLARHAAKGPVCSNMIAQSVHTNPVVIRRLMSELEKAELVASTAGRSGGFSLARPAPQITLADVYRAVEDDAVFRMHKLDPEAACPVAAQVGQGPVPAPEGGGGGAHPLPPADYAGGCIKCHPLNDQALRACKPIVSFAVPKAFHRRRLPVLRLPGTPRNQTRAFPQAAVPETNWVWFPSFFPVI